MKKLFLDTCVLAKLYVQEEDSESYRSYFESFEAPLQFVVAPTAGLEFRSTVGKKIRGKLLSEDLALDLVKKFNVDALRFEVVPYAQVTMLANRLIELHWRDGLRSLDALQLASAISVRDQLTGMYTADKILRHIAIKVALPVMTVFSN